MQILEQAQDRDVRNARMKLATLRSLENHVDREWNRGEISLDILVEESGLDIQSVNKALGMLELGELYSGGHKCMRMSDTFFYVISDARTKGFVYKKLNATVTIDWTIPVVELDV